MKSDSYKDLSIAAGKLSRAALYLFPYAAQKENPDRISYAQAMGILLGLAKVISPEKIKFC